MSKHMRIAIATALTDQQFSAIEQAITSVATARHYASDPSTSALMEANRKTLNLPTLVDVDGNDRLRFSSWRDRSCVTGKTTSGQEFQLMRWGRRPAILMDVDDTTTPEQWQAWVQEIEQIGFDASSWAYSDYQVPERREEFRRALGITT